MARISWPIVVCVAAVLVVTGFVSGCGSDSGSVGEVRRARDVAPAEKPDLADLSTPAGAVRSYLAWVSYAYRIGESDVASHTVTPEEGVRTDSYVQLNIERGRRIEQRLTRFEMQAAEVDGARAVVDAREVWEYRYLSADGSRSISETKTATYETTYTVVESEPGRWLVDSVQAEPVGVVE